jgi:hypothetical protein
MDANSGLAILGMAIGSAKLIEKVLGPTAEYLGTGLRDFAQHRVDNVKRIFQKASAFLGDKPPDGQAVPPRVLRDVLNDGSYRDDELTASYYGGILASSRSGISRDDRGAAFTALVGRLTTYQLRAHYILYRTINALYFNTNRNLQDSGPRAACRTFLPMQDYMTAMQPQPGEPVAAFVAHVFFGLLREALIESDFRFGPHEDIKSKFPTAESGGLLFQPSALGIELFLWATGNSSLEINAICRQEIELPELGFRLAQTPNLPAQSKLHEA